jgi:hypothetical protein
MVKSVLKCRLPASLRTVRSVAALLKELPVAGLETGVDIVRHLTAHLARFDESEPSATVRIEAQHRGLGWNNRPATRRLPIVSRGPSPLA